MSQIGRSNFRSLTFYIASDLDIEREACGITTNKSLFSDGVPVLNGLYDPHYGTTDMSYKCATCYHTKLHCSGHDGMFVSNYTLQSPIFRKEIIKWLRIVCHKCGEFVAKREASIDGFANANKLPEFVKLVRSGNEKFKKCAHCQASHPWVTRDAQRDGVIWKEWYAKGNSQKPVEREYLHNHHIRDIFARIPDANVLRMGKTLECHPKKLMINKAKVSSTVIRPEIRKIGGNRSTMADVTAHLKNIMELNAAIPKELPDVIDSDLHAKLVLIDLSFFEMIAGSAGSTTGGLKLTATTNKVSNSIANRLPKKHGRLRANLMGRRTTKMARSVITGDKALRLDQVGIPRMIARNLYIPETVRPWNRDRLTRFYLNGTQTYPGCSKIVKKIDGLDYYADKINQKYVLQDGDVVYRNIVTGDAISINREPALLYCSIATLIVKILDDGLTIRISSSICSLFNKLCWKQSASSLVGHKTNEGKECNVTGIMHSIISYNRLVGDRINTIPATMSN